MMNKRTDMTPSLTIAQFVLNLIFCCSLVATNKTSLVPAQVTSKSHLRPVRLF